MLTLGASSSCDVCLEDYAPGRIPHVYPCGHITCGTCCSSLRERVCPYCREPFALDAVRKMRVDFPEAASATSAAQDQEKEYEVVIARVEPVVRHNASCDICKRSIEGERYKCTDCPDWDACGACYPSVTADHRTAHTFVRIRDPADYLQPPPSHESQAEHPAYCNNCAGQIVGIRYKCSHPACADYDLCAPCEALLPPAHPPAHVLLKIRLPNYAGTAQAIWEGAGATVTCDGCARRIRGVRYKCTHPACPDLDICESCHVRPPALLATHPPHHELAVLRTAGLFACGDLYPDANGRSTNAHVIIEGDESDGEREEGESEGESGEERGEERGSPMLAWDGDIPEELAFALRLGLHEIENVHGEGAMVGIASVGAGMAGVGAGWR